MKYIPTPPVPPRAFDDIAVQNIDALLDMGVTQRAVAKQLGVHWRTVSNVAHRKGAYGAIPKGESK